MSDRYFVDEPISPGRVVLAGPEAHHLIHVMRAAPGMRVVLFDGSGAEFPAVVRQVGRNEVELSVLSREEVNRELPVELTLGVALPKGDRQKWLVEKAVELGVTRIVPLRTERGVAQPVEQRSCGCGVRSSRLRNSAAATACCRSTSRRPGPISWPTRPACPAGSWLTRNGTVVGGDSSRRFAGVLPHIGDRSRLRQLRRLDDLPDRVFLAVGPEGGFTGEEVALAVAAGWHTVDLGPRILRVETAALVLVAMVVAHLGRELLAVRRLHAAFCGRTRHASCRRRRR